MTKFFCNYFFVKLCLNSKKDFICHKMIFGIHCTLFILQYFVQQAELDFENWRKLEEAQMTVRMSLRESKKNPKQKQV